MIIQSSIDLAAEIAFNSISLLSKHSLNFSSHLTVVFRAEVPLQLVLRPQD